MGCATDRETTGDEKPGDEKLRDVEPDETTEGDEKLRDVEPDEITEGAAIRGDEIMGAERIGAEGAKPPLVPLWANASDEIVRLASATAAIVTRER